MVRSPWDRPGYPCGPIDDCPNLGSFLAAIETVLAGDKQVPPRKRRTERHLFRTAARRKRIHRRLRQRAKLHRANTGESIARRSIPWHAGPTHATKAESSAARVRFVRGRPATRAKHMSVEPAAASQGNRMVGVTPMRVHCGVNGAGTGAGSLDRPAQGSLLAR